MFYFTTQKTKGENFPSEKASEGAYRAEMSRAHGRSPANGPDRNGAALAETLSAAAHYK